MSTNLILEKLNHLEKRFDKRFVGLEKRFDGVDKRFDEHDKRFDKIDKRFEKVDERFNEQKDQNELFANHFLKHEKQFGNLENKMSTNHEQVMNKLDSIIGDYKHLKTEFSSFLNLHDRLNKRVTKLERKAAG